MSKLPPIPHPLPEPLVELVAQRFRVLGEPMRIKLLDRLREGDATVGELETILQPS
jgi:DNA-binding transcriptional ArsR family regulator